MLVHGEMVIEAGYPYRATLAIGDGSDEDTTDVWVRITPSFISSDELYEHTLPQGLTLAHHASTTNATLLHLTVVSSGNPTSDHEDGRYTIAQRTISDILELLNGIENGNWSDI